MEQLIFPLSPKEAEAQGIPHSSTNNREALFPTRLREERALKGVSQEELSKEIGVTKSTISLYENGDNVPDVKTLVKIAEYFNVNCNYLLCKTDIRKNDINIQVIGDYTGLSDGAINSLKGYKNRSDDKSPLGEPHVNLPDILNCLISSFEINTLLMQIDKYIKNYKISQEGELRKKEIWESHKDVREANKKIRFDVELPLNLKEVQEKLPYELWKIQKDFVEIIGKLAKGELSQNIKNGGEEDGEYNETDK